MWNNNHNNNNNHLSNNSSNNRRPSLDEVTAAVYQAAAASQLQQQQRRNASTGSTTNSSTTVNDYFGHGPGNLNVMNNAMNSATPYFSAVNAVNNPHVQALSSFVDLNSTVQEQQRRNLAMNLIQQQQQQQDGQRLVQEMVQQQQQQQQDGQRLVQEMVQQQLMNSSARGALTAQEAKSESLEQKKGDNSDQRDKNVVGSALTTIVPSKDDKNITPPVTPSAKTTDAGNAKSSGKTTKNSSTSIATSPNKRKRKAPSSTITSPATKNSSSSKKKAKTSSNNATSSSSTNSTTTPIKLNTGSQPNLHDSVPAITPQQYQNLDELMTQFCKVPLLAEFSRPVSLLHPELIPLYTKVVKHPIDLGKVCRAIRRRQYVNTRQVCVDVWRIFANCVKYHTHPLTREGAIPSFVSIANHLRDYFNALWLEYMIPSEVTSSSSNGNEKDPMFVAMRNADAKRKKIRQERYNALISTTLSENGLHRSAAAIEKFVEMGGRVDHLDDPLVNINPDDKEGDEAIVAVMDALADMAMRLRQIAPSDLEYPILSLGNDLKTCISDSVFQGRAWLRVKLEKRLDRLMGKIIAPINEASCRGVNQSSVWGCMAAAIWARETTKRPYWPAIVLGILAPDDQKEDWHTFLTERNEARLPLKLQQGLQAGKKKALQALARQNEGKAERNSFFLVEFLGTHEFIWVREGDIIEKFDPDEDANEMIARKAASEGKKKKSSMRNQTPANTKLLQKAIEEGRWALEEFDMMLSDPCGDQLEGEADDLDEENYSFQVLCESDDEADEADGGLGDRNDLGDMDTFGSPTGKLTDVEEINELLLTDGILDYSTAGRKNAKKISAALKKQQADLKRISVKKDKDVKAKKTNNANNVKRVKSSSDSRNKGGPNQKAPSTKTTDSSILNEQKELEKRRKKRERERQLKERENKLKTKTDGNSSVVRRGRKLGIVDKRGRAEAIVRGYLHRLAQTSDLKGLGLSGVLTIPAANVESTGLLGMALAFRAAAGELEMPNTSDNASVYKPWENIDIDETQDSEERCANLEKKIKLIEDAIEMLGKNDERRKKLIAIAKKEKETNYELIQQAEKDARQNDMPKRKAVIKKKGSQTPVNDVGKDDESRSNIDKENSGEDITAVIIAEDDTSPEDKSANTHIVVAGAS